MALPRPIKILPWLWTSPRACRAVGLANNRNPLPIVIPCHRIVGSNGSLVGYAGGLGMKERLLELERSQRDAHGR